jgi:hypothetical protein
MQVLKYVCKYLSFQNKFGRVNNFIPFLKVATQTFQMFYHVIHFLLCAGRQLLEMDTGGASSAASAPRNGY